MRTIRKTFTIECDENASNLTPDDVILALAMRNEVNSDRFKATEVLTSERLSFKEFHDSLTTEQRICLMGIQKNAEKASYFGYLIGVDSILQIKYPENKDYEEDNLPLDQRTGRFGYNQAIEDMKKLNKPQ